MPFKRFFLILTLAIFQLPAFAFTPVQSDINDFNQPTYTIKDIFASTFTADNPNSLYLSLTATKVSTTAIDYLITIRYENNQKIMLNIPKGETLTLLIDGTEVKLVGDGSINHRKYLVWHISSTEELDDISYLSEREKENVTIREIAKYNVSQEALNQLAGANEVKLKIRGEKKALIYTISKDTLIDIRHFLKQYSYN